MILVFMYFFTYVKIQATFFIWCPTTEAVDCGCTGNLGLFYTSRHCAGLPYSLVIQGFSVPPSYSFPSLFFVSSPMVFFCALFLPCIPPFKFHWYSGSAPSQTGKPLFVLECPLPQILYLHVFPWMPSLAGLALTFPYFPLFLSSNQKVLFCCIFSGSTIC